MRQAKVTPLPEGINLEGETVVITGASAGMGLETARQMLRLRCSTMVLAVRNVSKGEECVQQLEQDPVIQSNKPTIKVLKLDVGQYDSVQEFTKELQQKIEAVDILILNAGIGRLKLERSPTGHEETLQINYLSNVLILSELLPYLEASAGKTGSPTRISWVGSRMHEKGHDFEKKGPFRSDDSVFARFDDEKRFSRFSYANSKLLCAMFMYTLAPRLDPTKIVLNMFCPGMVNTNMSDYLPLPLRVVFEGVKYLMGRPIEDGGNIYINAAVVAGPETHGKYLYDKDIQPEPSTYIKSTVGQVVQKRLWEETMEEMKKITTLPSEFC
ncbi:hypothetical protein N7468_005091 [Penicillium chermesinum]|uniref:Uncharacterized protein n=1 Tax=Penicillium chermesinum TaxID=63820 RepID=A0A9W9TMP1_9EURO|nr:uncharacterized protein N7468_005091 [Penicillium chermesinum]KAJ5232135.1 hypothetical protein N7468_005091 [Penicillium chermesinum]KAJ6171800.1 hypothetical protein N7470_000867 [Penicillium chermesinum]